MCHPSGNLQKAVAAFGPLPKEVAALGEPLSVHPPSATAALNQRFSGLTASLSGPAMERKLGLVMSLVMPILGVVFLICYLSGLQIGDMPRVAWLVFAGVSLLFGVFAGGCAWYLGKKIANAPATPPPPDPSATPVGFIFYPSALVQHCGGKFTVIRWQDV